VICVAVTEDERIDEIGIGVESPQGRRHRRAAIQQDVFAGLNEEGRVPESPVEGFPDSQECDVHAVPPPLRSTYGVPPIMASC
jgi:hypothetical protein